MIKPVALIAYGIVIVGCTSIPRTDCDAEADTGFINLFNGDDLEGWIGNTKSYRIHDGAIHLPSGGTGNLLHQQEFADFVLRFEFKLSPGANSGLAIRSPLRGTLAYAGIELQILDDDHPKWANQQDWQYHGSVYGIAPAKRGALKPTGEWNQQQVTVEGRQITVHLNGQTILDVHLDNAVSNGTLSGREHPGVQRPRGHVGFVGQRDEVWFRHIRIKELQ